MDNQGRLQIQNYLCTVSGQVKVPSIQEMEHDYARPPPNHPDAKNRAKSTIYLFMKNFPRHVYKQSNYAYANCKDDEMVDVVTVEEPKKIPFLTPRVSFSVGRQNISITIFYFHCLAAFHAYGGRRRHPRAGLVHHRLVDL